MDGNELSYLRAACGAENGSKSILQASALPDWAQRFLQQPAGADRQNTQRFSAVQRRRLCRGADRMDGAGRRAEAAPIVFRENKQPEAQHPAAPARLSDSELRRGG